MPKPIWTGAISFGLLNIPVSLMPGERRTDLHFRMLDHRDNSPIRYERVNAETGEEVPWKDIVKAFEYEKGSYVVVEKEDIANAAPDSAETVDIEAFIDSSELSLAYFEKPYWLVPPKKAEKGYVLLRDTLRKKKRVGLARVVIRTRESLAIVIPEGPALLLLLLRFPAELLAADEYTFPEGAAAKYKISPRESAMAESLIESMTEKFEPAQYKDEFREKLGKVIEQRVKQKEGKGRRTTAATPDKKSKAGGKVVDFMSLLKKSIDENKRTPAAAKADAKPRSKAKAPGKDEDAEAETATPARKKPVRKRA